MCLQLRESAVLLSSLLESGNCIGQDVFAVAYVMMYCREAGGTPWVADDVVASILKE